MKRSSLEAALQACPFRPFEIRVDADVLTVHHPEQVFLAENKSTVVLDCPDRIHIFDVSQISKLSLCKRQAAVSRPRPGFTG